MKLAREYGPPLSAALITFVMLGILFSVPYVVRDLRYPLGFDVYHYVTTANQASVSGIQHLPTPRVGTPLLVAVMMRVTGQNAFTVITWLPGIVAGVAGLGAAAMVRAAVGIKTPWVPIVGVLTWAAFGLNAMFFLHLDNLLNAALILSAYGAALAFVASRTGAVAVAVLLTAAGLVHWPFYAFAMAVYVLAVAGFAREEIWGRLTGNHRSNGMASPLLGAAAVSAVAVGLPVLTLASSRKAGVRLVPSVLRERFLLRLGETYRYWAFPMAAVGALGAATVPLSPEQRQARRLFFWLMSVWVGLTVIAGIAQWLGIPVAGARLIHYFFPATILAGVMLWWGARALNERFALRGRAVAALIVVGALVGFGALSWRLQYNRTLTVSPRGVRQVATAGEYATRYAPGRPLALVVEPGTRWREVSLALPPDVLLRTRLDGRPAHAYLTASPDRDGGAVSSAAPETVRRDPGVAVLIERLNQSSYRRLSETHSRRVIAPGVLVLRGPIPRSPPRFASAPAARTSVRNLIAVSSLIVAVLFAVGLGWAAATLPRETLIRAALAPGLGVATTTMGALAWAALDLPLHGWNALAPLILAALLGWVLAAVRSRGGGATGLVRSLRRSHATDC